MPSVFPYWNTCFHHTPNATVCRSSIDNGVSINLSATHRVWSYLVWSNVGSLTTQHLTLCITVSFVDDFDILLQKRHVIAMVCIHPHRVPFAIRTRVLKYQYCCMSYRTPFLYRQFLTHRHNVKYHTSCTGACCCCPLGLDTHKQSNPSGRRNKWYYHQHGCLYWLYKLSCLITPQRVTLYFQTKLQISEQIDPHNHSSL